VHLSGSVNWLTIFNYSTFGYQCKILTIGQFVIITNSNKPKRQLASKNNHKLFNSNIFAIIIKTEIIANCQPINTTTQMHNIKSNYDEPEENHEYFFKHYRSK
jgi:hypothetical protein